MNNDASKIEIIPTCVPQSHEDLFKKINQVRRFAPAVHVDIDDGIFTPQTSWPYVGQGRLEDLTETLDTPVDNFLMQIHLMVSDAREIGEFFIQVGAQSIIAHVETVSDPKTILDAWRRRGAQEIGIAILLNTPLEKLEPVLPFCDFVLVLSVETIGAQGAPFDPRAIDRIRELHTRFPDLPLMVDGGINESNIASLVQAGASRFSVGSAIAMAENPGTEYTTLLSLACSTKTA